MKLAPGSLHTHLQGPLAPLYLLHGSAPLLVIEAGDAIRSAAREQGIHERETLVVGKGFRWEQLFLASGNISLFGDRKLIDLRIPGGKPGRDGSEALQRYVQQPANDQITVISLPEIDWAVRKSTWFKALENAAVVLELNTPERNALPDWIAQRLARQQQQADADTLNFIADHVEGNLLAAHQEILKLGLLHPPGSLTLGDVQSAVLNVARYDLSTLRQAMLEGDAGRSMRILDGLRAESAPPPLLLWMLSNELRQLATLRSGLDARRPANLLFKELRIFDAARQRELGNAARRLSVRAVHAALLHAARVDRIVKGIGEGDFWDECLILVMRIARVPAGR